MAGSIVKDGYDKAAEAYLQERNQFESDHYLDVLAPLLKPRAAVLDLGCGAGMPVDRYLVDRGFRVTGLDISEKQVELARAHVPEAIFAVADMLGLRAGEYQVDAVVSFYAIFHLPRESHGSLFRTIKTFLGPGGYLLVTMGASEWEGAESDFYGVTMWWSHYGPDENRAIIRRAGFEILLDEIDESGGERHQVILARALSNLDTISDSASALLSRVRSGWNAAVTLSS